MSAAKISPTYVRPDKTAVITCPHCSRQKTLHVDSFPAHKHLLKIKCACDRIFTVHLEYRKRVRKKTNLRGTYVNHTQNESKGSLTVRDISVSGLSFTSLDHYNFNVDDELSIKFALDDEHQSEIRKEAIVRVIHKTFIGCEFEKGGDLAFDGPLGLYIMS
jgi:hypothetical protein